MPRLLPTALVLLIVLTQSYIDLEIAVNIGGWEANAPIADLAALATLPFAAWGWWRGQRLPLPGVAGYAMLLLVALLSLFNALDPQQGLHTLLRKPVFLYIAYGFGVAWAVAYGTTQRWVRQGLLLWAGTTAVLSLATSVGRIAAGEALWFQAIAGLTPNHKTLAVSLAGGLPLLAAAPSRRVVMVCLIALIAIVLSASKTAWLMVVLGAGLFWPGHRPLSLRWRWSIPAAVVGLALAYYAPILIGSRTMFDAARSRHSLNRRALMMFRLHPLVGSGVGMSTVIEQATFPDYRVNGIDAHGVVQKLGGEMGALGVIGYGWFSLSTFTALRRRWEEEGGGFQGPTYASLACWGVSSAGLLLSTETFSQTWWAPLAVAWGTAHAPGGSD